MRKLFLKFRGFYDILRFKLGIHPLQDAYRPDESVSDWIDRTFVQRNEDKP